MKKWVVFVCCLALFACNRTVHYDPSLIVAPEKIIERVMTSQPPEYAETVPSRVSVKNDCIEMWTSESGGGGKSEVSAGTIYYKNIGKTMLNHTDIWYVSIIDHSGILMYNVFSFKENEAKQFIDALYTLTGKQ